MNRQVLLYGLVTLALAVTIIAVVVERRSVGFMAIPVGVPLLIAFPFSAASLLIATHNPVRAARFGFWASAMAMPAPLFQLATACLSVYRFPIMLVVPQFLAIVATTTVLPMGLLVYSARYSRRKLSNKGMKPDLGIGSPDAAP